jgi:hypothetical protein
MSIKIPCHVIDSETDPNTEVFWDGFVQLGDGSLHVEMRGRSGMGPLHAAEVRKFDVPVKAIRHIEWKDCEVGSLLEIGLRNSSYADKFPGTREDNTVVMSLREVEEGLADVLVESVRNAAAMECDRDS